jgi:hypothetical protein
MLTVTGSEVAVSAVPVKADVAADRADLAERSDDA